MRVLTYDGRGVVGGLHRARKDECKHGKEIKSEGGGGRGSATGH